METGFRNRSDAGKQLASLLRHYTGRNDTRIFALPRGGVPVAYEVARMLRAPLDVFLVRKLGVPTHEELAMGAIAEGGYVVINENITHALNIAEPTVRAVMQREQEELERYAQIYRGDRELTGGRGQMVILVDDGLATGASMRVATRALRDMEPARLIIAVPVAPPDACRMIEEEADEVVCVMTPKFFTSVGSWYEDFRQVTDEEVRDFLSMAQDFAPAPVDHNG